MKKRLRVLKRGNCRCAYCGAELKPNNFTVDHKYPRSSGGSNSLRNLKPSCTFCNNIKGDLTLREFKCRLLELSSLGNDLSRIIKSKFDIIGKEGKVKFYFEKQLDEKSRLFKLLKALE